jgi:hypothetical protein
MTWAGYDYASCPQNVRRRPQVRRGSCSHFKTRPPQEKDRKNVFVMFVHKIKTLDIWMPWQFMGDDNSATCGTLDNEDMITNATSNAHAANSSFDHEIRKSFLCKTVFEQQNNALVDDDTLLASASFEDSPCDSEESMFSEMNIECDTDRYHWHTPRTRSSLPRTG